MANKLIIPMIVLAKHISTEIKVPSLNPNYKTALANYLGKYSTPSAFNMNLSLKRGVHLHFVLPSCLKNGMEEESENGEKTLVYPAVPDRYIVTRTYVSGGKIVTDSNIVESNFYSLDKSYSNSITIPKFDDTRPRHRFRYLGRKYSAFSNPPEPQGESGYFEKITALGGGDPIFSAYYPSCSSVFGFYDDLNGVPSDAVLTYFVIGYYSNSENDFLNNVSTADDMKKALEAHGLSSADDGAICNSCVLFGEVGGIDLAHDVPETHGEINIGIGKTSAEAMSAIIKGEYYQNNDDKERFLTSLQYDSIGEEKQPDGNFKVDDDIHYRGFSRIDPIETTYALRASKKVSKNSDTLTAGFKENFKKMYKCENDIGKLNRLLDYKKNSLYYMWEMYMDSNSDDKEKTLELIKSLQSEISEIRQNISNKTSVKKKLHTANLCETKDIQIETAAAEPYYLPKDPAVMLFGSGMNRTYAFGEDGRFESGNTLYCLTAPLISDITNENIIGYFDRAADFEKIFPDFGAYAAMAVILDENNLLAALKIKPKISEKYSPILYNGEYGEKVTLFMQWETEFRPNYSNSSADNSSLDYGNTDYMYNGKMADKIVSCDGISVLTPHQVHDLHDKLVKYIKMNSDSDEAEKLAEKIKDMSAVSQILGGFNLKMSALKYTCQFPVNIDGEELSKSVADTLEPNGYNFFEPSAERLAVCTDSELYPLRDGYFDLTRLAVVTTFGEQKMLLDDTLDFSGKRHYSESLYPLSNGRCSLPLGLNSAARLSTYFVNATQKNEPAAPFRESTPVIALFMPDILNRNLNVFTNTGERIGIIKTAYSVINGKKTAVGRFSADPFAPSDYDTRIKDFIEAVTGDNTAFSEVMSVIEQKLEISLPLTKNNFIFGRVLVLAEVSLELQYFGAPEWSKKISDIGNFNDKGLSCQKFPVYFGDKNRVSDGFCCGFYDDFSKGFPAFGIKTDDNGYLSKPTFGISSEDDRKNVTLLFDPMLKITLNTGILPVKQIELCEEHTDFSGYNLMTACMNNMLSGESEAEMPVFAKDKNFVREYPTLEGYHEIEIVKPYNSVTQLGKTIITDGLLSERK